MLFTKLSLLAHRVTEFFVTEASFIRCVERRTRRLTRRPFCTRNLRAICCGTRYINSACKLLQPKQATYFTTFIPSIGNAYDASLTIIGQKALVRNIQGLSDETTNGTTASNITRRDNAFHYVLTISPTSSRPDPRYCFRILSPSSTKVRQVMSSGRWEVRKFALLQETDRAC